MTADATATRPVGIAMLWHSPNSANLGVGALTLGNMALAREAARRAGVTPRFHLLGFADPGKPSYVVGPDVDVTELDMRAFLPGGGFGKALRDCDIALDIGGGDSFTDIYGPKRLAYLFASKFAAILKDKPLILSPQTIGPFDKAWARLPASMILKRAERVFVRDPQSLAALGELAPDARAALVTDVAFALPYDRVDHEAGIHVGINVSGLLFNGGYSGRNEFGLEIDYPAYTRQLIARFLERSEVTVHLVPHVLSDAVPQDDDVRVAEKLAAEFPALRLPPPFAGPIEAKSYIAGLDMLVGGRMHACIAAHSSGVAVVPVAYSRKFSGLFQGLLEYPHMVPVTGMSTEQAVDYTLSAFERRAQLASDCERVQPKVQSLLDAYVKALAAMLGSLASRR